MSDRVRYAIVTPYYKEEKRLLERCIQSVREQSVATDHILVADGYPQDWIDNEAVRHIRLDRNHADYGNTPRAIGAILAVSAAYEGIGFLDADNWLEPRHVASCIAASRMTESCDYVIAQRNLCRPDGSVIKVNDPPSEYFVDTSCFFLLPGSYHVVAHFSLMPAELAPICDRVFHAALKARRLKAQIVPGKTVNYHCLWSYVYRLAGETPPPDAKGGIDYKGIKRWLDAQDERQLEIVYRRAGSRLSVSDRQAAPKMATEPAPRPPERAARGPAQ